MEEDAYCRELYGCTPVEYLGELGWTASRRLVRALRPSLAGGRRRRSRRTGVGVAHCPTSNLRLGAGVAPVRELVDAGVRVGLGVDGSASNERSDLFFDVKQALLVARGRGGPAAMTCREALRLGTRGGADVLARDDIGSIEAGKCADLAVWRTDGLELGGAEDPVAGLVLSAPHRVDRLLVGGEDVVRDGHLVHGRRGRDRPRAPSPGAGRLESACVTRVRASSPASAGETGSASPSLAGCSRPATASRSLVGGRGREP